MHPGCVGVLQDKKQALTIYDINILSKLKHSDIAKRLGNKTSQNVVILMAALPCRQSASRMITENSSSSTWRRELIAIGRRAHIHVGYEPWSLWRRGPVTLAAADKAKMALDETRGSRQQSRRGNCLCGQ